MLCQSGGSFCNVKLPQTIHNYIIKQTSIDSMTVNLIEDKDTGHDSIIALLKLQVYVL